jgi:hypothetical protein
VPLAGFVPLDIPAMGIVANAGLQLGKDRVSSFGFIQDQDDVV